jgi:serine/threonine-protein kinase
MELRTYPEELAKVLASPLFAKAGRQAQLLRYLVEKSATPGEADLKEYTIALEVFERPATYDPRIDSVVRVEASKLRARLERYYQGEGAHDPVRFSIPKGSYTVRFEEQPAAVEGPVAPRAPVWRRAAAVAVALACAGAVALWSLSFRGAHRPGLAPVPQPSIAVLPFVHAGQGSQSTFADGLTDEVTSALARLPGWNVVSRTSAAQFAGKSADVRQIGAALNVHAVLEGRVRYEEKKARLTAQLVDTADGFVFWSDSWEHDGAGSLEAQKLLAGHVLKVFRSRLLGARRALVRRDATNKEAYQQYLRASVLGIDDEPQAMQHSLRLLKISTAADPNYALPWAGMSRLLISMAEQEIEPTNRVCGPAKDALDRARAIEPMLVEASIASAWHHMLCEWNWKAAEDDFRQAIEGDPSFVMPLHDYGRLLVIKGQFADAEVAFRKALSLDPQWNWLLNGLANTYIKAGRLRETEEPLEQSCAIELLPGCLTRKGVIEAIRGQHERAVGFYRQALRSNPRSTWINGHLGYSLALLGKKDEAAEVMASMQQPATDKPIPEYEVAAVYSALGEKSKALDWLERALSRRSPTIMYAGVDFRFAGLREESRFRKVLQTLHMR